jgi:hypothetical protein
MMPPKLSEHGEQRRQELTALIEELMSKIDTAEADIEFWEAECEALERALRDVVAEEILVEEACRRDRRQLPLPLEAP